MVSTPNIFIEKIKVSFERFNRIFDKTISPEKKNKLYNPLFILGYVFIFSYIITLFIVVLSLWLNIPLTKYHFPISVVVSCIVCFLTTKYIFKNKYLFKSLIFIFIYLSILCLSGYISYKVYDSSYDGQTYHQQAILELKKGGG